MFLSFPSMASAATWAFASPRSPRSQHYRILQSSSSNLQTPKHVASLLLRRTSPRTRLSSTRGVPSAQTPPIDKEANGEDKEDETAEEEVGTATTLRDICKGRLPDHILQRAEEVGFVVPTEVQTKALPLMLSGKDCILHSQTGSGKTLAYLFVIFSTLNFKRSAVQALIVVPTRELGMQVTKVARILSAKSMGSDVMQKTCTVMALLDGGLLKRHKIWLKAEPPEIVVATISSLTRMVEKHILSLEALQVLVIDEVDFMFHSSKQVRSLKKLINSCPTIKSRQTIFASASIPQHNRFLHDCIQQKWMKKDAVHVHVNPVQPMPPHLCHRYVICKKQQRLQTLLALLQIDASKSAIIFVNDQSERSKQTGEIPSTILVIEFLKTSYKDGLEIHLLEEDMNFNARATSLYEIRQGCCLLVATDLVGRGVDLPETSHIYNFDLPKTAVNYLHRAGRTCRKPFSEENYIVTTLITREERFVLQRYENELLFQCEEVHLPSHN